MKLILQQRQTLSLTMTLELRQAIELLQYSTLDLIQFLKEQEMENPLIELVEKTELPTENYSLHSNKNTNSANLDSFESITKHEVNLHTHLIEQLSWYSLDTIDRKIVQYLIYSLDENGYLPLDSFTVAEQLEIEVKRVADGIQFLQQLEPAGVGARDLKECLLLQLRHYYPTEKITETIIENHLEPLASKRWQDIAKNLDISLSEVTVAFKLIQELNPKPCAIFSSDITEYITPDIIISEEYGKLIVNLNESYMPDIRFNHHYIERAFQKKDKIYIKERYNKYQWLLHSLRQRRETILKITNAIIKKQKDFFSEGFSALKPLTLKDIAQEIQMHESTVSRATSNKVIQTPKGTFDLRLFFTPKLNPGDGTSTSQTKVKLLLKEIIKKENKMKPFSDQKIADFFKTNKNITISRRTIAKYREELNIPSSSMRKEWNISDTP